MITQELVKELLHYDPETGEFTHKVRGERHFKVGAPLRTIKTWNTKNAGRIATTTNDQGYKLLNIFFKSYRAHRVAWIYVYGCEPEFQIDHINGVRSDNRISNLRCVSNQENSKNSRIGVNNTTGVKGVSLRKDTGKYQAKIKVDGKDISLGCFVDLKDAAEARKKAERKFGFHNNHGSSINSSEG